LNDEQIVWTKTMIRMCDLVKKCVENNESVLLIGETGTGKTTAVQLVAKFMGKKLRILNCHQHTETADFLGGMRPVRSNSEDKKAAIMGKSGVKLFEWIDGPLVEAMKEGSFFLLDEINMAEDAVLERINSVLEQSRTLTLAEKSSDKVEVIKAKPGFCVFATMNPGGDYGKKELTPAMRSRFTEIYVNKKKKKSVLETRLCNLSYYQLILFLNDFFLSLLLEHVDRRCPEHIPRQNLPLRYRTDYLQCQR